MFFNWFGFWRRLFSFIWDSKPKLLSIEEACDILNQDEEENLEPIAIPEEENVNEYDTCLKKGIITFKNENKYQIDDLYEFESNAENLYIGSRVSYKIFITNCTIKVTDVKLIENDWDVDETGKSTWCSRIMVCKVVKRENRNVILEPGDVTVDLDKISIEFIPIIGDWVEIHVKSEVDINITDFSGKILEIDKVNAVRPHIKNCVITSYNAKDNFGILNKNIYFLSTCLPYGYIPQANDKVIAEIIESDQGTCVWRALKILPEALAAKKEQITDVKESDLVYAHEHINISSESVELTGLNLKTQFFVLIENISDEVFLIKSVGFKAPSQSKVTSNVQDYTLDAKEIKKICCDCESKSMGDSRDLIEIDFGEFKIGYWVSITVGRQSSFESVKCIRKGSKYLNNYSNEIIAGQRVTSAPRFCSVKIPDYTLPRKLLDIFNRFTFRDAANIQSELQAYKPSLFNNLTLMNYEDKFHTLLYLEEISEKLALQNYDQDLACFIRNGEYLMLEINNLKERRPSLLVGDKIIASDPTKQDNKDFEGFIHKVGGNHVYLKFSPMFHDSYNGEDYSIRAVCGRGSLRSMHHAIFLAVKMLGKDILFCTQLTERELQVNLRSEEKQITRRQALEKMYKLKNKTPVKETAQPKSIDWYNESLNCYQKEAVKNILLGVARPLPYVIFGPPGTGKTVTIIETILQLLRMIPHCRLLVSAPSNSASDLIALRLINSGVLKPGDLVRVISFSYLMSELLPGELVPYSATLSLGREGTVPSAEVLKTGMTLGCSSSAIGRHRITVSTCGSAGRLFQMGFKRGHFSHIVVDESGQASEPEVLIPVTFLDKYNGQVILAGDPVQLGPVISNPFASDNGLGESFLERLLNRFPYVPDFESFPETSGYDPRLVTKLRYNYRSLEPLLNLTSSLFYNNDLLVTVSSEDSKEAKTLAKLKDILPLGSNSEPPCIVFHGVDGEQCRSNDSPSWYNPHEAAQVFYYINELYRMGLESKDIGVITPYVKQSREVRLILTEAEFDCPKIGTVEEFQGQEFNVVLVSTVRSSSEKADDLNFISCPRRINVTISRAKCLLIIIGNPNVLSKNIVWRSVINYCISNGAYTGCQMY
ncbi:unnamed protein product [Brassicogethes aeneus]|uniref:RNA helicase n=1 Tax=Brassicogethes aeneus TaxID=1431903 RepID=A0A9P0ARF8_BRAAE|nr:unnamed protein product [Brassicogethes aeneus]